MHIRLTKSRQYQYSTNITRNNMRSSTTQIFIYLNIGGVMVTTSHMCSKYILSGSLAISQLRGTIFTSAPSYVGQYSFT